MSMKEFPKIPATPKNPSQEEIDDARWEQGLIGPEEIAARKDEIREAMVTHAAELSQLKESLPFPGLNPIAYVDIKRAQEEFPGYSTPIDELVARFMTEGMKVVFDKNTSGMNAAVVPGRSTDYDSDSVLFRNLQVYGMVDVRLKALITLMAEYKKLNEREDELKENPRGQ
jgi:hypothetical protein